MVYAEGEQPVKVAELLERYVRDGANTFVVEYPNMINGCLCRWI
ncbi:hypothetical protein J22TS1_01730 [Siminovitchia terrae]|nr:hypothetical protein J22TS1_01730 [Siminovitchia terrae]